MQHGVPRSVLSSTLRQEPFNGSRSADLPPQETKEFRDLGLSRTKCPKGDQEIKMGAMMVKTTRKWIVPPHPQHHAIAKIGMNVSMRARFRAIRKRIVGRHAL